jgi:hypothetical protein
MYEELKVHSIKSPYGDPEKWAKSTLTSEFTDFEKGDLVLIHEITPSMLNNPYPRERIWLHDALDENEIPYKIDITGEFRQKFGGIRRRRAITETQLIFVMKEHEKKARRLIRRYKRSTAISDERVNAEEFAFDEYAEYDNEENTFDCDNIPQVKCPNCEQECDSDYTKCPNCQKNLYG